MNSITIHNYEAFLLDSVEGNLTGEQQLELDVFLIQHPQLCIDTEDITSATFDPQRSVYNDKAYLKKTGSDLVSEDQFIAYVEEQLLAEEKVHVEKSCSLNHLLAKELELYKNTIATADVSVIFENKENLKRKAKVIWLNFSTAQFTAAASIALLISLYFLWPGKPTANEKPNSYANNNIKEKIDHSISHSVINTDVTGENKLAANNSSGSKRKIHITTASNNTSAINITANTTTINTAQPDTLAHITSIKEPGIDPQKETFVITESLNHKTIVDVISENDDDEHTSQTNHKQGFWSLAGKALKKLNKAGVKSVDGEENSNDATYALTLGALNITHKSN